MVPLSLITGFLGSGKTTLLQNMIARHCGRRVVYLVNEFGAVDIDGQHLELRPGQFVSIPGGSIFCRCLTGEFIRVLRDIADDRAPQAVVVEASGVADPKIIRQMLVETKLDRLYRLRQIVTIIDPGSFLKLLETLPNITAQVEAADLAIINKTDLYDPEQLDATEQAVRRINPPVQIVRTQHCDVAIEACDVPEHGESEVHRSLVGEYAACADPNYITRCVSLDRPMVLEPLLDAMRAVQPHVYRVKGFVRTPAGVVYIDVSAGGVIHRLSDRVPGTTGLVFIAGPEQMPQVEELIRKLQPDPCLRIL
jgi:G3E family GTPase